MNKNVSVILCHPSDTIRPLSPSRTVSGTELLLIDKKDNSFEVQSIDSFGDPVDISKEACLQVIASAPNVVEDPVGMTFRLKEKAEDAVVTVTVTWNDARNIGPFTFQLHTHIVDGVATVVPVESDDARFVDADIRSTSPTGDLPKESAIRKRAGEIRVKRKAELEAKAKADKAAKEAKAAPHPGHPVEHKAVVHPPHHHEKPEHKDPHKKG